MYKNGRMFSPENHLQNFNQEQKRPKRIEWLNIYSKGFIAESINNNYINQNISIKKNNKKLNNNKNIIPRNKNNIIPSFSKKGFKSNKNIIGNSNLSSKKTNFSQIIDEEEDFCNQNKSLLTNINNIFNDKNNSNKKENKKEKQIYSKTNEKKNNIKKRDDQKNNINKKIEKNKKNNSVKNIKYYNEEYNYNSVKVSSNKKKINKKILLKRDISSPLINYLKYKNKNFKKTLFKINNKNIKNLNRNNSCFEFSAKTINEESENEISENGIEIKKNKKYKHRYSKPIREIKLNNLNLIEIQKSMAEGRKFKKQKNIYGFGFDTNSQSKRGEYSFDDDLYYL